MRRTHSHIDDKVQARDDPTSRRAQRAGSRPRLAPGRFGGPAVVARRLGVAGKGSALNHVLVEFDAELGWRL